MKMTKKKRSCLIRVTNKEYNKNIKNKKELIQFMLDNNFKTNKDLINELIKKNENNKLELRLCKIRTSTNSDFLNSQRCLKHLGLLSREKAHSQKVVLTCIFDNFPEYKEHIPYIAFYKFAEDNKNSIKEYKAELKAKSNNYIGYRTGIKDFYSSPEWRKLRYEVLREQEGRCQLCGRTSKDGVVMHCDHITPLSKDWSKRLDKNNIQVLCEDCNLGKSNTDSIDWR